MLSARKAADYSNDEMNRRERQFGLTQLQSMRIVEEVVDAICVDTDGPLSTFAIVSLGRRIDRIVALRIRVEDGLVYPGLDLFSRGDRGK